MELKDWKELGTLLKRARTLILRGYHLDERPKTRKREWERIIKRFEKVRSDLDNIVFRELSDSGLSSDEIISIFYGEIDRDD